MNCQQVDKYILNYCDNTLFPELTQEVEEHLQDCAICKKGIELTKAETAILYSLDKLEPSYDFTAKVMENITNKTNNKPDNKTKLSRPLVLLLPIAAVFILLLTTSLPGMFSLDNIRKTSQKTEDLPPQIALHSTPGEFALEDKSVIQPTEQSDMEKEIINHMATAPTADTAGNVDGTTSFQAEKSYYNMALESGNEDQPENISPLENTSSNFTQEEAVFNDRKFMQQDNPNRADQHLRIAPTSAITGNINISPQNVPVRFNLSEIQNPEENAVTYCYIDELEQITLDITIAQSLPASLTDKAQKLEFELLPERREASLNYLNIELTQDKELYIITVKSNLPEEEMTTILSSITFTN